MDKFIMMLNKDVIAFQMVFDLMQCDTEEELVLKERIGGLIAEIHEFVDVIAKNKEVWENDNDRLSKIEYYTKIQKQEEQRANTVMDNIDEIVEEMDELVDENIMDDFRYVYDDSSVDSDLEYQHK